MPRNLFLFLIYSILSIPLGAEEGHDHDHDPSPHEEKQGKEEHADHADHDDHDDHDDHGHGKHDDHHESDLPAGLNVVLDTAGSGFLAATESFPAEVGFNQDRVVHLVPKVSGVVGDVQIRVGQVVKKGQILARIESRELADTKSNLLAASARYDLADTRREREQRLRNEEVNSIEDVLAADQAAVEAKIHLQTAMQKLLALGFDSAAISELKNSDDASLTSYPLRAPMDGTVIERHLTTGEHVDSDNTVLTLADLRSVWVDASIPPDTRLKIQVGDHMEVLDTRREVHTSGEVILFTPFADPERRTLTARLEVENPSGEWIPGLFATVHPRRSEIALKVVLPKSAVQRIENEDVVFVPSGSSFSTSEVELGQSDATHVQILKGLQPGDRYVREGAFDLKAIMITKDMDPHAGHGH